jgi:hypothetical protein
MMHVNDEVEKQRMYRQSGQGSQGASLISEGPIASTRSFINERTDLTATEVSPRMTATIIEKTTGKPIKINTRVVKLSQEKTSIKMLNIKGIVQTKRFKRMMQSFQEEVHSASTVNGAKFGGLIRQGTTSP